MPDHLISLCKLRSLRRIHLNGQIVGLPACIGSLNGLLELDVRGCALGSDSNVNPFPNELRGLTRLRTFTAFQQSTPSCIPAGAEYRHFTEGRSTLLEGPDKSANECRAIYDEIIGESSRSDPRYVCSRDEWIERLDDTSRPWWGWNKLQHFWIDANGFRGNIPPSAPDLWPKLQFIDLYSNRLEGPFPQM